MNIKVKGKNIKSTQAIEEYLHKKLSKMDKYFEKEEEAIVTILTEKSKQIVEIQINTANIYRARCEEQDLYASIDKAIDILEGQVRKTKAKNSKKIKDDSIKMGILKNMKSKEERIGEIIKFKYYDLKPMSPEDAKLQLESKTKSQFLVFVNSDTKKVNVIFRTKDSRNYGIVEPM